MKKLLIVDDSEDIIDLLFEVFNEDFIVYRAKTNLEVLKITEKEKIDIAIIDYNLNDNINGVDISCSLKEFNSSIVTYILTASGSNKEIQKEIGKSIDGYFNKSLSPFVLLNKIKEGI